jgi:transposase
MRTYWRQRNDLIRSAARHVQRMQKALTQMNIQLANVLSEVSGVTGQAIIQAILAGERDPRKLAAFRDKRVKASEEEIARSLEGNWQEDLLFMLKQEQDGYEFCQKQMSECDDNRCIALRQKACHRGARPVNNTEHYYSTIAKKWFLLFPSSMFPSK